MGFKLNSLISLLVYCVIMMVCWIYWGEPNREVLNMNNFNFVDTEGCVIPYFNPFDETVLKFRSTPKHLKCSDKVALTYQENLTLKLNRNTVNFSHCEYQQILRSTKSDSEFLFSNSTTFSQNINITMEFVRVFCYDWKRKNIYTNYHAFTPRKTVVIADLDKKLSSHKQKNKPKEILNVLMIGIDSLSRLNHIRHMPKTRNFLLKNLSAIDLQGYTKVADNTFINVVPMTTGNYVAEEYIASGTTNEKGPFDKFNIIWKNFSANGYSTMFSEDAPFIAMFNYLKLGFVDAPVDHYLRPFSCALEKDSSAWHKGRDCVWDRSESKVVLDYSYDFVNTYRNRPHFGYTFISRLTHDNIKYAAYADDDYVEMLHNLKKEGLLNNTVLFFYGDHGMRFGGILKTDIGQIELRMPLMYLSLPTWISEKYPQIFHNIVGNSRRLTSPFDIFETLKDILYFTGKPREANQIQSNQRGISLFDPIPDTRTCDDASILPQWCVCKMVELTLAENDSLANQSVHFLIRIINEKSINHSMCEELVLRSVKHVKLFTNKDYGTMNTSRISLYRIHLILMPGDAEYGATLKYKDGHFKLAGDISRESKYGHTADCVENPKLRKYCYCRNQTTTPSTSVTPT